MPQIIDWDKVIDVECMLEQLKQVVFDSTREELGERASCGMM